MSRKSEEKLRELAVWYHEHKAECSDLEKRVELLEKTMTNLIWLFTYFQEDLQALEHRERQPQISLPRGVILHESLR